MSIFVQPTISHFRESKLAFDDAKLVFHLCPDAGFVSVSGSFFFGQLPVAAALRLGEVFGSGSVIHDGLSLPAVGRIAPYTGFLPMKQIGQYLGIVDVGRCCDHGMNESRTAIDADMGLHAEVPRIAFACLAHIRVALFLFVLGGTRCIDDTGINNRAAGNLHPVFLQILIHQMEQLIAQIVLLHQVAELANRGFVRNGLSAEVNADELPQAAGIVEGLLGSRIRQVEPVLDKVDTQHTLDTDGPTPSPLGLGVDRLDNFGQFLPGNTVPCESSSGISRNRLQKKNLGASDPAPGCDVAYYEPILELIREALAVIRVPLVNTPGAIQLLSDDNAYQRVRQCHCRQRPAFL